MAKKRKVKPARSVGIELLRWLFGPAPGKAQGRPVRQSFAPAQDKALRQAQDKALRQAQGVAQGKPAPARGAPKGAVEVTADTYMHKLTPEARARLEAQEKTVEEVRKFVEEHPEEASQLLRVWLTKGKRE